MRIPKKLKYRGVVYDVKQEKLEFGGEFRYEDQVIEIGKKHSPDRKGIVLIHEIMEMILMDNYARFFPEEGQAPPMFMFDHTKLCTIADDLYAVLRENKLNFAE